MKTYEAYVRNKTYIGYGIVNGIINAIIYLFIHLGVIGEMTTFNAGMFDMFITSALLGLILTWFVVPLTKGDIKKGVFDANMTFTPAQKLPKNTFVLSIVMCVVTGIAGSILSAILIFICEAFLFNWVMMIIKGIVCAIIGGLSGFIVIEDVVAHKLRD